MYDDKAEPGKLIGANRIFLERELPHIASIMRPSVRHVVEESDVVVVANGSKSFRDVPNWIGRDKILIDLVGITHTSGRAGKSLSG